MKLEKGKRYVRRNGEITPPIVNRTCSYYPFWDNEGHSYTPDGKFWRVIKESQFDLVSEYIEQPELPDAVYYVYRVGGGSPFREHKTQDDAQNEAMRLAGQHPESVFRVLKTIAIVTAPMPVPTITKTKQNNEQ